MQSSPLRVSFQEKEAEVKKYYVIPIDKLKLYGTLHVRIPSRTGREG